jgi:hypothetical protein
VSNPSEEVFVSYSHDSPAHIDAVLTLSNRLRADGVDCVLDQYETSPPEGWPRWMDRRIRTSKFVLMICTETYCKRVMGEEQPGHGHGVRWEGNLIYQHLYDAGTVNTRFVPVILRAADRAYVPDPVRGATIYAVDTDSGYEALYSRLAGVLPHKPALGSRRPLPTRAVKTNPKLYLTTPIDLDQWNKAGWKAVAYGDRGDAPPLFALAFKNGDAARAIFEGWRERYGDRDQREELRISIIEGDLPGKEPGYSVNISTDLDVFVARLKEAGFEYDDDLLVSVSRTHRMNPDPGSTNLETFKRNVRRNKAYILLPAVYHSDTRIELLPGLEILKGKVLFRHVRDLHPNDPDVAVLATEMDG